MQTKNRQTKSSIEKFIKYNYSELSFIELLKLLKLDSKKGTSFNDLFEKIDIKPHLSLTFQTRDIQNFEKKGDRYLIAPNFLSLYGPTSSLPIFYTEDLLDEQLDDNNLTKDFYDIFHKRKYQQYFQAHLKYRLSDRIVENSETNILNILYSFIGEHLKENNRSSYYFSRLELLKFANLFIHKNRTKEGLRLLISGLLDIKVTIIEFIKNYEKISKEQLCSIGVSNCLLDENAHLGDRVLNISNTFKIVLSDLNESSFSYFQKNSTGYKKLAELVNLYLGKSLKWIVEYQVCKNSRQPMQLGVNSQLTFNQ